MDETTSLPAIRTAAPDDAPAVAALLSELGYPDNSVGKVRDRLATWGSTDNTTALVAQHQARLVGVVAVTAVPCFERDGSWGRIVALVVARRHRGYGTGRRLVEAAENAARDLGCLTMEITSARRRNDAHAFYEAVGYQDWCRLSARFIKDLVPGASAHSYAVLGEESAGATIRDH